VTLNILLGVLALIAFCGLWKFCFYLFHRYEALLLPAVLGYSGWLTWAHFFATASR
jgi:uncharacterized membrane protein